MEAMTSLMMPLQVVLKLPAKKPYVIANARSIPVDDARPQNTNTESNAPIVERRMAVVMCVLSMTRPNMIQPSTAEALSNARVAVAMVLDEPMDRA